MLTIGSLFAGTGGLDLGIGMALGPARTAWVSDIDQYDRKGTQVGAAPSILAYRFPDAPNLGDITTVDWAVVEPVDIICGGSPCQDLSLAGRRAGMRPGTRSGLWESMLTAITVLRPHLVIWENVYGALSAPAYSSLEPEPGRMGDGPGRPALRALGRVLGDLAAIGFDAEWTCVRASDVGAPHQRTRLFVAAHPHGTAGDVRWQSIAREAGVREALSGAGRRDRAPATDAGRTPLWQLAGGSSAQEGGASRGDGSGDHRGARSATDWGPYAPGVRRWERLTRPAPPPLEMTPRGASRLSPRFVEWMMGLPDGWVTDVPGMRRTWALHALGNGVVPQQAAYAITSLVQRAALDQEVAA